MKKQLTKVEQVEKWNEEIQMCCGEYQVQQWYDTYQDQMSTSEIEELFNELKNEHTRLVRQAKYQGEYYR